MSESQQHRPTQVTIAAGAVIGGALLLFASGFDSMDNLHTVDFRERIAGALASGTARDLGFTVDQVIGWVRVATLVSGGAAAAAAVLGWFAMQRHRGARVALAAIAVVLLICAPFAGGLLAAFVVAAIAMLWSGQARDWFAGRPVRQRAGEPAGAASSSEGPERGSALPPAQEAAGPEPGTAPVPPPTQGFGDRPTSAPAFGQPAPAPQQPTYPSAQPSPYLAAPHPSAAHHTVSVDQRPTAVVAACLLTWIFAGIAALVFAVFGAFLAVRPYDLVNRVQGMQAWQDAGLSASMIQPVLWAAVVFYVCWAAAACVLAFFAWRRHSWARILLVVSAIAAVVLGIFAIPASLAHLAASAVAAGLLLGGSSNRWYARRTRLPGPGPQQPMGPPPRPW